MRYVLAILFASIVASGCVRRPVNPPVKAYEKNASYEFEHLERFLDASLLPSKPIRLVAGVVGSDMEPAVGFLHDDTGIRTFTLAGEIALADILFGGDRNMVVINMSEYKEDHKISRLTGSAPGYVGYGEGGVLTEAVRRKPYSVVLLDEIEKARRIITTRSCSTARPTPTSSARTGPRSSSARPSSRRGRASCSCRRTST